MAVAKLCGHRSKGPSGESDQGNWRTRSLISPRPPEGSALWRREAGVTFMPST
jgi:hypothetical protein